MAKAKTPTQFIKAVAKWRQATPEAETVTSTLVDPQVQADLQGQLFVDLIERDKASPDASFKLANAATLSFAELPFDQAVEFWKSYGGDQETLDLIIAAYRTDSEESVSLFYDALARSAVSQLQTHIGEGGNTQAFINDMRSEAVSFGIEPASPAYLENVYRTNIATAYSAGRAAIMEDPDTIEDFPYAQFFASGDSRTRSSHQALDQIVVRIGSPIYQRLQTPLSYQCRCAWTSLSVDDFEAEGLTVTEDLPASMIPAGF